MKKGRFSEEQMVGILREADRSPVAQVAKKHGISEQTSYSWRQRFAGMSADDVKRLRLLEQENTCLKKILAERDLEIEIMKEIAAKNGRRTRPAPPGGIRQESRAFTTQGVCAVIHLPIVAPLRVAPGGPRQTADGGDDGSGCDVSALRISPDQRVHGAPGAFHGRRQSVPVMVQGRIAGTQEAATETSRGIPSTTATANGSKRTVGVRLCLRRLC